MTSDETVLAGLSGVQRFAPDSPLERVTDSNHRSLMEGSSASPQSGQPSQTGICDAVSQFGEWVQQGLHVAVSSATHKARRFAESGRSRSNSTPVSPTGNSWTGHLDLSPARTNPGFCETQDSRCTRGTGLVSAPQESTLALKTGPLLSRSSNRLHDS